MAEAPEHAGETLGKKAGPFPMWVWVVGGGGLVLLAVMFMGKGGSNSASSGAQNAVNPNAQIGAGAYPQGMSIGNLLSYNQIPGAMSAPQVTSSDPSLGAPAPAPAPTVSGNSPLLGNPWIWIPGLSQTPVAQGGTTGQ